MSYQGVDFDCDKPRQYKMLREAMAKLYRCGEETKLFGPISVNDLPKKVFVRKNWTKVRRLIAKYV